MRKRIPLFTWASNNCHTHLDDTRLRYIIQCLRLGRYKEARMASNVGNINVHCNTKKPWKVPSAMSHHGTWWYDTLISMNHTYMSVLPNTPQAGQLYPCMCHWPLPNSSYNIINDPRQRLMPADRQHYQYSSPGMQILKNWNMRFTIKN